jgi:hypothetical protein
MTWAIDEKTIALLMLLYYPLANWAPRFFTCAQYPLKEGRMSITLIHKTKFFISGKKSLAKLMHTTSTKNQSVAVSQAALLLVLLFAPYPWPLSGPQTKSNKSSGSVTNYCP